MAAISCSRAMFFQDILEGGEFSGESDNDSSSNDDCSISSTAAVLCPPEVENIHLDDVDTTGSNRHIPNIPLETTEEDHENEVQNDELPPEPASSVALHDDNDIGHGKPPKHCSIAHNIINNQIAYFVSLDIETAGDIAGIVQLSAELCRTTIVSEEGYATRDTATRIKREPRVFNKYVDPNVDAKYWSETSIEVHGIRPTDKSCLGAVS